MEDEPPRGPSPMTDVSDDFHDLPPWPAAPPPPPPPPPMAWAKPTEFPRTSATHDIMQTPLGERKGLLKSRIRVNVYVKKNPAQSKLFLASEKVSLEMLRAFSGLAVRELPSPTRVHRNQGTVSNPLRWELVGVDENAVHKAITFMINTCKWQEVGMVANILMIDKPAEEIACNFHTAIALGIDAAYGRLMEQLKDLVNRDKLQLDTAVQLTQHARDLQMNEVYNLLYRQMVTSSLDRLQILQNLGKSKHMGQELRVDLVNEVARIIFKEK